MIAFEFNAVKNGVTELMCIVQISSNLQISMIPNYILDMAQSKPLDGDQISYILLTVLNYVWN